jgi:cardiolipin synthase
MRSSRRLITGLALSLATLTSLTALAGCGAPGAIGGARLAGANGWSAQGHTQPAAIDSAAVYAEAGPTQPQVVTGPPVVVPSQPDQAQDPMTEGNTADLHVFPTETLPAVKALIANAKQSVYLEVFNFGNDSYGKQLVPLLIERAKAGCDVRVLMDYVGSRFIKGHSELVAQLRAAGVDVKVYKPRLIIRGSGTRSFNITHRKVYLADGEHALVGGVNLMAPFDTTTQDLLIDWRGPVVGQLYNEYAHDWQTAGGKKLSQPVVVSAREGHVSAQIAVTSPDQGRLEAREAIFSAIDSAQREILIEQQYFWDDTLMAHLHAAVRRGVKLRVLVPGGEQKLIQKTCNGEQLHKLVGEGAEARLYHGVTADAHLHTKYFNVDDRWTITGSVNGDSRSLMDNQELDMITTDPALIQEIRARLFEKDWAEHTDPFIYVPGSWVIKPLKSILDLLDYYL